MAWRPARYLLAGCLVLAALLVLADLRGAQPARSLRGAAGAVVGGPEQALAWVRSQVGSRLGGASEARARIAVLEDELARARADTARAAAGSVTAQAARELAAGVPEAGYRVVPARVVALASPQDQVASATITVGSAQGVAVGDAVLAPGGLAGLVASVAPGVATVRLLVDPSMALPARVAASGEVALVRGEGTALRASLLDPLGRMAVGNLVVTMGTPDGRLPADLPIGRITAIEGSAADLTRAAAVAPSVDLSTLDRVAVLVPAAEARP
ncbi:MAG TPA: rod shape-determining protein MreC [Candidatus Nanopelagicales bacterium]